MLGGVAFVSDGSKTCGMLCRALRSLPRGNSHRNIHTRTMQHVDINLAMRHYNHQVQVALDGTDAKLRLPGSNHIDHLNRD